MRYQNKVYGLTSVIGFLSLLCIIVSCNNQGSQSKTAETTTSSDSAAQKSQLQTTKVFMGNGGFAYLTLPKAELDRIFFTPRPDGMQARKMVFRFRHNGPADSRVVVQGFPTNHDNAHYPSRNGVDLTIAYENDPPVDLSNREIFLSDLELEREQYLRLRAAVPDDRLLLFTPYIRNDGFYVNSVSYWVRWIPSGAALTQEPVILTADNQLNPSPPADPQ